MVDEKKENIDEKISRDLLPFYIKMQEREKCESFINKIENIKKSIEEIFEDDFLNAPETKNIDELVKWVLNLKKDKHVNNNEFGIRGATIASVLVNLKEFLTVKLSTLESKVRAIWNVGKRDDFCPFDKEYRPRPPPGFF